MDNLNPNERTANISCLSFSNQVTNDSCILDDTDYLKNIRDGAVLNRSTLLKSDHFSTKRSAKLKQYIVGAPNFRKVSCEIYGTSQPTFEGLLTILALLNVKSNEKEGAPEYEAALRTCYWCCMRDEPMMYIQGRTFVLREQDYPMVNMRLLAGIDGKRVEQMEERLKQDIIEEARKNRGVLLVHCEIDNHLVPCWIEATVVQTPREVYELLIQNGFRIKYCRVPISAGYGPEDRYFDAILNVSKLANIGDPLVFNCQLGRGRTTMGMVIATIARRARMAKDQSIPVFLVSSSDREFGLQERTLFKILRSLDAGLVDNDDTNSVTRWLLSRSNLLESLYAAVLGNYQVILDLLRVLDEGSLCKDLVDIIVDDCDAVINIREAILTLRVQITPDDTNLIQALSYLERYFCLIAFASYVNEHLKGLTEIDFSKWMRSRPEIVSMLKKLRSKRSNIPLCFRPLEDLAKLDPNLIKDKPTVNQMERFVIKNRGGAVLNAHTILKLDHWGEEHVITNDIEGAPNFRKVEAQNIYGTAQPTLQGIKNALKVIFDSVSSDTYIHWINLREEPLIYINGKPFVLRDEYATLRNIRTHAGIGAERIHVMENKLKCDVLSEVKNHHGKILLHEETAGGLVVPVWEEVTTENVKTFGEIMDLLKTQGYRIIYSRIAITAEESPEDDDFDQILHAMLSDPSVQVAYVFNCQMGLGRSTLGTVVAYIIRCWLRSYESKSCEILSQHSIESTSLLDVQKNPFFDDEAKSFDSYDRLKTRSLSSSENHEDTANIFDKESISGLNNWSLSLSDEDVYRTGHIVSPATNQYGIILSLLRTLRNGLECKYQVDSAVYKCDRVLNLIESINLYRHRAEQTDDDLERDLNIQRGIMYLKRYFCLILFQAYLFQMTPMTIASGPSFKIWKSRHHELSGMFEQLSQIDLASLMPINQLYPAEGFAQANEVVHALSQRRGSILASNMILKSDHFPGSQKASLVDRIIDAPNFRVIQATFHPHKHPSVAITYKIAGVGMPTKLAIRDILKRLDISKRGPRKLLWICLREEPVVFVNNKPYVLRNFQEPLRNLESTGIAKERLETMEARMKKDILAEAERNGGLVLLHSEEATSSEQMGREAQFKFIPVWEDVGSNGTVETAKEVFQQIRLEGYPIEYLRIPITDEQAPVPEVFDEMFRHLCQLNPDTDVLFNCQMGRGRTTTGMVIAYLIELVRSDLSTETSIINPSQINKHPPNSEEEHFLLNGEYRLVLQVVSILQSGKRSKWLVDTAINACDHIQNLREAIYFCRLRTLQTNQSISQTQKKDLSNWAIHYLYRYCYLILFADYLLERKTLEPSLRVNFKSASDSARSGLNAPSLGSFKHWLSERHEIVTLFKEAYRDFII